MCAAAIGTTVNAESPLEISGSYRMRGELGQKLTIGQTVNTGDITKAYNSTAGFNGRLNQRVRVNFDKDLGNGFLRRVAEAGAKTAHCGLMSIGGLGAKEGDGEGFL